MNGTLHHIGDVQTFASGFSKREFVIKTDGEYPQFIKFELMKDRTKFADNWNVGEVLDVSFDIRGNEHNGKFYNNLNAWKVERLHEAPTIATPQPATPQETQNTNEGEDIPF